ncbi:MAG: hypothetical protein GY788_27640, partial [bacterium]|nr:hypothetical protein [bacterium]
KNLDWPGADEIAERLKTMLPQELQEGDGLPAEVQQMIQQGQELIQQLQAENAELRRDKSLEARKHDIDAYEAETGRLKAVGDPKSMYGGQMGPDQIKALVFKAVMDVLNSPDIAPMPPPKPPQGPGAAPPPMMPLGPPPAAQ